MRTNRKRQGGFTLIELITVIVILGILAAVVAPRYFDMADEAQDAALQGAISEGIARFNMSYAQYILDNGNAPTTLANLTDAAYLGADVTAVDIGDFTLSYVGAGNNPTVTLTATDGDGNTANTTFDWPNS